MVSLGKVTLIPLLCRQNGRRPVTAYRTGSGENHVPGCFRPPKKYWKVVERCSMTKIWTCSERMLLKSPWPRLGHLPGWWRLTVDRRSPNSESSRISLRHAVDESEYESVKSAPWLMTWRWRWLPVESASRRLCPERAISVLKSPTGRFHW